MKYISLWIGFVINKSRLFNKLFKKVKTLEIIRGKERNPIDNGETITNYQHSIPSPNPIPITGKTHSLCGVCIYLKLLIDI